MASHEQDRSSATSRREWDAIIIGAGMSGMYQLYRLRRLGLRVRVLEAGTGVGGTWYWNRYPGARFDSESYSYGYSFSQELLDEWDWSEHFAGQPETLRYLNFVADKFDLRRDIQFRSRVTAAAYDDHARSWCLTLDDGSQFRARFHRRYDRHGRCIFGLEAAAETRAASMLPALDAGQQSDKALVGSQKGNDMTKKYTAQCACGAVKFEFNTDRGTLRGIVAGLVAYSSAGVDIPRRVLGPARRHA